MPPRFHIKCIFHDFFVSSTFYGQYPYPYWKNFPKMSVFQRLTSCPLSLPSRSFRCPRSNTNSLPQDLYTMTLVRSNWISCWFLQKWFWLRNNATDVKYGYSYIGVFHEHFYKFFYKRQFIIPCVRKIGFSNGVPLTVWQLNSNANKLNC